MKKVMMSGVVVLAVLFLLVAGCLDYKAYNLPKDDSAQKQAAPDDASLVNEIAQVEKDIKNQQPAASNITKTEPAVEKQAVPNKTKEEVKGEVVLPELKEEKPAAPSKEAKEAAQTITVDENELVKLNVKVTDPDKDPVTYTFSAPLDKNGEWKTNYGDAGEYIITIKASDGKLTTEKAIKIVVNRVNVPPIIENIKDIKVKEGETITFEPKVNDPNKDKVKVTITPPLDNGKFVTDHTSAGEYRIKVTASDGELEAEKNFLLTIEDVNVPPTITNLNDITLKEGQTVTIKPTVTDADGDTIVITIGDPVGNKGVWKTTYTDHGIYLVKVMISDGKDTITKNVKVTVDDVNMAPEIVDVSLVKK